MKYPQQCPRCGLDRKAALDNLIAGDPYAQHLLGGCPECRQVLGAFWEAIPLPAGESDIVPERVQGQIS